MPTHDYIIANGTGAAVRADINLALSAIVSLNSSASEPATMYAYQLWADTAAGLLKIRNSANSAWITLRQLDGDFSIVAVEDGLQATPSLTFTNDLNTGIFRPGNDSLAIVTGATRAITITSTQAVGIKTANPSTDLHVAGNARVGADDVTDAHLQIGKGASGNRNSYIDIVADTTYTDYGLRIIRNNTGANATSELKHRGTGALNFTTQEAAPIVFNTTNSPALTILAGGNVGIGNSDPRGIIHVGADLANGATDAAAINLKQTSTTAATGIYLERSGARTGYYIHLGGDLDSLTFRRNYAGTKSDVMSLTRDGLVGIGSTGPLNQLTVKAANDDGIALTRPSNATINHLLISTTETGGDQYRTKFNTFNNDFILSTYTGGGTGGNIRFRTGTAADPTDKVIIDSSGRLLVGTTSADGLISNISPVVAGAFKSHSGSVSIAPSTTVTIFTIPASNGEGAYTVTAIYVNSANVAVFSAYAVILYDGAATNAYRAMGFDGSLLSITVSGRNVQLTTGAIYTQDIKWSFVKQAVA